MAEELNLKDISHSLKITHIKLNLSFLNELLRDASKSDKPHRDQEFARKIGCPINENKKTATTIYGWMKGYRTIHFSKITRILELSKFSWKDIEKNLLSIKSGIRKGEISPKFPIKIDYKLGSIVGHILGDGSIDKRFHSLFYSNSNPELLKEFSGYMKEILGIEPRIWVQDKPKYGETKWLKKAVNLNKLPKGHNVGLFYPKICSDILYAIIGKFAEGKNKFITNQIKNANLDFKKGLVKAFFDDEGSVNSENYTVRFHQDKKDMLECMRNIFLELDVKSNSIRSYKKREKLRYYFNITGFREYSNFYNNIGCTSSNKKREFELLINKVKNSKYFKRNY